MFKTVTKAAIVASAIVALPGMAQAGTAAGTGAAAMTVSTQCSVTGASVDLGTFNTSDSWGTVSAALGSFAQPTFTAGSRGFEYLNFGSVNCGSGVPYTLYIKGTSTGNPGLIKITLNGKTMVMMPAVKKLGGNVVADNAALYPGTGAQVWSVPLSGTGTGAAQTLVGNATLVFGTTDATAIATDRLGASGAFSDMLNYTLNF